MPISACRRQWSARFYLRLCLSGFLLFVQLLLPQLQAKPALAQATDWWSTQWDYRVGLTVAANGYARTDKPAEIALNFTNLLNSLGQIGAFDANSLRLIEVNNGSVVNADVPFQFDPAANFNPTSNASGTLVFLLTSNTAANSSRSYHLYFDLQGKGFSLPNFADQVAVTTANDEGQSSFRVQTATATYFYQKDGGGFSSLLDANGNDWLNYHPTPANSPSSTYRGIPNMVHPEGKLHPGATGHTTTLVNSGPLKETVRTVINTDSDARQWDVLWEFFPSYSRMTLLDVDHDYWFLYEGTPGGDLEPTKDFVVRSNGAQNLAGQSWAGDLAGEEWAYFADPDVNRSLYLINHAEDTQPDSYRPLGDSNGDMTVFGFGRQSNSKYMSQIGVSFTIGLINTTTYANAAPIIRGAYKPLTTNVGSAERRTGGGGSGSITIVKDAQPNAKRNFVFTGTLGKFRLDDPNSDDGDPYSVSKTFTVNGTTHTVQLSAATGWVLTNILCTPTTGTTVNLGARQVQINLASNQNVSCAFVSQRQAQLRVQQLADQAGTTVTLYDAAGTLVDTQTGNQWGKSSFMGLTPGAYTLCRATQGDCTGVTLVDGETVLVQLTDTVQASSAATVATSDTSADDPDEVDESVSLTDDEWLNQPELNHHFYLPLINSATP